MTTHSYAWWAARLAASVRALLDDSPNDLVLQRRRREARTILEWFDDECSAYEGGIRDPENAPQSIRAELAEIAARPELLFRTVVRGENVP